MNVLTLYLDKEMVASVGWTGNNELFSIGDDKSILRWSGEGEFLGNISLIDPNNKNSDNNTTFYITDMKWFPPPPGKGQTVADTFVAGGSDGNLKSF